MNVENTKAQMRKGILEFCILEIIGSGETYASEIIEKLRDADLIIVEGTLYPILTRLKNAEQLQYGWVESNQGPPRKYYSLTREGKLTLKELNNSWDELVNAIEKLKK